jgi:fatty-acyl-CoA synthase
MDGPLTLNVLFRRAETLFRGSQVVSRRPDRELDRVSYAEWAARTRQLALALTRLGLRSGDRVGTLCWNHHQHLEAYFAVPLAGGVLHTLNLRLHPDDLAFIINHAGDRFVIVDAVLWPLFERVLPKITAECIIVIGGDGSVSDDAIDYETLIAGEEPSALDVSDPDERRAAAMCYTTGTTGQPKGVLYSHRALALHSLAIALMVALTEEDTVLPVVPMFHANAWGLPYACIMQGSRLVFPGPYLDVASLADLIQRERVTFTAGVPTIWMGLLQLLDTNPGQYDLSSIRRMLVGGSAAPVSLIQAFQERHGLHVQTAWGMTEMTPLGTVSLMPPAMADAPSDEKFSYRSRQGRPVPFVEIRARNAEGLVCWDGTTMGELEVRGPWVARAYFGVEEADERFTEDGWFRTGDIVTIDAHGTIAIQDRAKDLIKSGGEWISSQALENALMCHPAVAEAAVIAIPDARWDERPLAVVVLKAGHDVSAEILRAYLAERFAKWWLPDRIEFVDEIPRTSVGKFQKTALRQRFG